MREKEKTWYRICKMLCEYKKYFPGIFCCLLGSSFIMFLQPLIIRQITDCGMLQKNMNYILFFWYINNNFFNPARVKYNPNKIIFKCT